MSEYDYPVTVQLFYQSRWDGEWMPELLADAIGWLQKKMEEIPPEYRASANIEIDSVGSWEDSHYASIEISYERPATPGDIAERRSAIASQAQKDLAWAKKRVAEEEERLANIAKT